MSLKKNENIGVNLNKLEVHVDKEVFNDACERAYKKEIKKIRVPGFRVGKAPRKVVEKIYGKEIFYDDAINFVYGHALDEAIKESKLDVVSVDEFNVINCGEEGLDFSVNCTLKPKIEVKKYKGYEINKEVRKVKKEDIDNQIQILRERAGRIVLVEEKRAVEDGDLVVIDFKGFVGGISFKGGSAKDYNLRIGSKQFIEGFEDQVKGHKVGDEFDINVTFPKNYHSKDLSGKDALFRCELKAIKDILVPEENDEFAKDVSEFKTLKELREDIKNKMEKANENNAQNQVENVILENIVNNIEGDIPNVMFENRFKDMLEDFKRNIGNQGFMNEEQYFMDAGIDGEAFIQNMKDRAVFQVKLNLALEKIAEIEKIEATDEEVEEELKNIAEHYKMKVEDIRKIYFVEGLKNDIINRKVIEFVKENSEIKEKILEN